VPDGDLFEVISDGRASVVTDRIETLTETGLALSSGAELEADLIVTATGLKMVPIGGIRLCVDGRDVDLGATLAYRGMQISGVPNMAFAFGYANQSWTLGSDLTAKEVCRIVSHMDRYGHTQCTPRTGDAGVAPVQFIDLSSGYIRRAIDRFPKQGSVDPWRRAQSYTQNRRAFRRDPADDRELEFSRSTGSARPYLSAAPASTSPAP
jgi:monooxygenase